MELNKLLSYFIAIFIFLVVINVNALIGQPLQWLDIDLQGLNNVTFNITHFNTTNSDTTIVLGLDGTSNRSFGIEMPRNLTRVWSVNVTISGINGTNATHNPKNEFENIDFSPYITNARTAYANSSTDTVQIGTNTENCISGRCMFVVNEAGNIATGNDFDRLNSGAFLDMVNFSSNITSLNVIFLNYSMQWDGSNEFWTTSLDYAGAGITIIFNGSRYMHYIVPALGVSEANITNGCIIEANQTPIPRNTSFTASKNISQDYTLCGFTGDFRIDNITLGGILLTRDLSASLDPRLTTWFDNVFLMSYKTKFPSNLWIDNDYSEQPMEFNNTIEINYTSNNSQLGTGLVLRELYRCLPTINNTCHFPFRTFSGSDSTIILNSTNFTADFNISSMFTYQNLTIQNITNITVDQTTIFNETQLNSTGNLPIDIPIGLYMLKNIGGYTFVPDTFSCLINNTVFRMMNESGSESCLINYTYTKGIPINNDTIQFNKTFIKETNYPCDALYSDMGIWCHNERPVEDGVNFSIVSYINNSDNFTNGYIQSYKIPLSRFPFWDSRQNVSIDFSGIGTGINYTQDSTDIIIVINRSFSTSGTSTYQNLWRVTINYTGINATPTGQGGLIIINPAILAPAGGGGPPTGFIIEESGSATIGDIKIEPLLFRIIMDPKGSIIGTIRITSNRTESTPVEFSCRNIESLSDFCNNVNITSLVNAGPNDLTKVQFSISPKNVQSGKNYKFNILTEFDDNKQIIAVDVLLSGYIGPFGQFVGFLTGETVGIPNVFLFTGGLVLTVIIITQLFRFIRGRRL